MNIGQELLVMMGFLEEKVGGVQDVDGEKGQEKSLKAMSK